VYPLFLECDRNGEVLWMSDRTRSALGGADTLARTIIDGTARTADSVARPSMCFSRVMEAGGRVLFSAEPRDLDEAPIEEPEELLDLQGSMLRHYFRLESAERKLSARRRRGGGRQAIRQMERERQRLGSELHTGVGQMLAAIRLQLEVISSQMPEPAAAVKQALERIGTLASDALEQVRSISRRLHPPEWQRLTLPSALQQLWDISGVPQRFEAVLHMEELAREPEQTVKVLFYRAAQEALSNLIRHSKATRIEMTLTSTGEQLQLKIQDNGVGFNVAEMLTAPPSLGAGIGLRSIREQAAALGGKLVIESGLQGTTLLISAPYSPVDV
jgi:signal transduction histidine kinase